MDLPKLMEYLEARLASDKHAVVVVAEGAQARHMRGGGGGGHTRWCCHPQSRGRCVA